MPTIKRLMDVAIVGMVAVDLALTGLFVSRRHKISAPSASTQDLARAQRPANPGTATTNDVSAAMYLLLRAGDISSEVFNCPSTQPYVSPSANAQKWDYGGGTNTAHNWCNWNGNSNSLLNNMSYSYEDSFHEDRGTSTSTSSKP